MAKQAIIIGLGQFGMSVARALTERGMEVLAVDKQEDKIRTAAAFVTQVLAFDAMDSEALAQTAPDRRDVSLCAIGDESREASIICTALLRQMGAPRVIARANSDVQARILHLVGAHEVVNPEREYGERFANRVLHTQIVGELPLGDNLLVTELLPPASLVGQSLRELRLESRHGVTVVALRRVGVPAVLTADAAGPLRADDILVLISPRGVIAKFLERV